MTKKYHYTYTLDFNDLYIDKEKLYVSNSPKNACMKIVNRLLRNVDKDIVIPISVINLDKDYKVYYYKCMCVKLKEPIRKQINRYKEITIRYDVVIVKYSEKFVNLALT